MGTSSELSLSCISLSGEWSKGTTASFNSNSSLLYVLFFCGIWGQWRRMAGNCRLIFWAAIFIFYRLPTRLQEPGAASFQALVCVCPLLAQSGSSEMIIQSSSTSLHHARHSGVSVPAFSFSQWHTHHVFLGYLRAMSSQLELQKAFSPASSPNTAHTYTLAAHLPKCWLYLAARRWWQRRQNSFFFHCQQSFQGNCVSCSSRDALYTDLRESHGNGEKNQLETNVSHQQTLAELGTVCQTRRGNEQKLATAAVWSRVFRPDADRCQNYTCRKGRLKEMFSSTRLTLWLLPLRTKTFFYLDVCLFFKGWQSQTCSYLWNTWFIHTNSK